MAKALNKKLNSIKKRAMNIVTWCFATLPRKIISSLVIAGILFSSAWFLLLRPKPVEAGWFDEDWLYRQPVSISAHSAAETDVYIIITDVDTSDTSKFQADCGDLRFTKYNGELLDYYIDSGSRGGDVVVHVLFDTFPAGAQTIYYYFGNPSADNGFKSSGFSTVATQNYTVDEINTNLEEKGTGPVLWLRFDEGYGTTAYDSSEQNNNGTISGASWTDYGKFGKALDFDTPGDLVTVTQNASLNLSGKSGYSISAWIYPHSDGGSDVGEIIDKGTNNYFRVDSEGTDGYLNVEGKLDLADTDANLNVADAIRVNRWSHILLTYEDDDDDEITIYVNGVNMGSSDGGIGSLSDDSGDNLLIGGDANATFDGIIDEVKIYPYARDADQIKRNYNQGAAARIGRDDSWLTEGLVGYWKMDETSWTGAANEVEDSSGAGNHGVRVDGATTTGTAKFGRAGTFDGAGDYVNIGDQASLEGFDQISISLWFKFTVFPTGYYNFVQKEGIYKIDANQYNFRFLTGNDWGGSILNVGWPPSGGKWYHIVATYDGSIKKMYIDGVQDDTTVSTSGNIGSNTADLTFGTAHNGTIDEVGIWNRALSAFEVRRLYDWGPPPVAEYKFDEYSGSTAYDTSENSNDCAITNATWRGAGDCKYGSCLDFDGAGDYVHVGDINETEVKTVTLWVRPNAVNVTEEPLDLNGTAYVKIANGTVTGQGFTSPTVYINGVVASTITTGWNFITITTGTGINADDLDIGRLNTGYFNGTIDDVKIYNYVRTQKQIIEDMIGSRPAITERTSSAGSMMGYWKFDQGYGTIAEDASGRGNDLTLSAESYTMSGKFGKAWDGDGTKYLSVADDPDFDFTATENFTISMWFKSDSADNPGSNEYLIDKESSSAGYAVYMDTGGDVIFGIDDDNTWGPDDTAGNVGIDFYDNTWHHMSAIKTATSSIAIFIDGIKIGSDDSISAQGDLTNSAVLYIGDRDGTDNGDEFNGDIDEVKIYRFALSPEEILLDYNKGKSVMMGAVGTELDGTTPSWSQSRAYCPPGFTGTCNPPVAEWKMDEKADNTCAGGVNDVCDTSANTNDGAINGNPVWKGAADCKYGSCLDFDGSGDYVHIGDTSETGVKTVSLWIKPDAVNVTEEPLDLNGAAYVKITNGTVTGEGFTSPTIYINGISGASTVTTDWNHIVITTGTGLNASDLDIGRLDASYFDGKIDDVKMFDYALTQEQIAWLYNKGKPVGHWKMDEGEGATAYDSSVNNNSGTISGAAWSTSGKYNSALDFDGTNDYVEVDSDSSLEGFTALTLAAWVSSEATQSSSHGRIISKTQGATGDDYAMSVDEADKITFRINTADGRETIEAGDVPSDSSWHFIVCTWKTGSNNMIIYQNGDVVLADTSYTGTLDDTNEHLGIGGHPNSDTRRFNGLIDEVKIYNYALTAEQIKIDYNQGSALRFGD